MELREVQYGELTLAYRVFGEGPKSLLAFHGFGRNGEDFKSFEPFLGEQYTLYAFDLFFHGRSLFPVDRIEKKPLDEEELKGLLSAFLHEHNIAEFSLMGYSLGGKIALDIVELFSERINELYLLAPDGIRINKWYHFITHYAVGRAVYRYIIKNPKALFVVIAALTTMRILPKKVGRFIYRNMKTEQNRKLVYHIWLVFSKIKPNISRIQKVINERKIKVHLIFGKNDRIILPKIGRSFNKGLQQNNALQVINAGHFLLTSKTGRILQKRLMLD